MGAAVFRLGKYAKSSGQRNASSGSQAGNHNPRAIGSGVSLYLVAIGAFDKLHAPISGGLVTGGRTILEENRQSVVLYDAADDIVADGRIGIRKHQWLVARIERRPDVLILRLNLHSQEVQGNMIA